MMFNKNHSTILLAGILATAGCVGTPATPPAPATTGGLSMPRDVQEAFRKGTRSLDGRPGPNY